MTQGYMAKSKSDDWETPKDFFEKLNREFKFDLDPCATKENAKCERFFSKEQNGLNQVWNGRVFCNPPYSEWARWIEKGYHQVKNGDCEIAVFLIPSRTDTKAFHKFIYNNDLAEIRFIKGRLSFGNNNGSAPFPSMVVIFKKVHIKNHDTK